MGKTDNKELMSFIKTGITIAVLLVAFSVQWGSITATLDLFQERLNMISPQLDKQSEKMSSIEKDVAFIKGQMEK